MDRFELRKILSENIKTRRKLYSLTQEKLAEAAELSAQTINDIEGCRTWVSDNTLTKIADALSTTPAELLERKINNPKNVDLTLLKSDLEKSINLQIEKTFSVYSNSLQ